MSGISCKQRRFTPKPPEYNINVQALTQVQPTELDASEIEVRIGATWVEPKYIEDFMRDVLKHRSIFQPEYNGDSVFM